MKVFVLFLSLVSLSIYSQNRKGFFELSPPKRTWAFFHPFKANKAFEISKEANKVFDSISKTSLLDGDGSGGQVDAFRHAYWMARLRQEIGRSAAKSLGVAHEKENYLMYKERKLEDGIVPDKISSEMNLWNNDVGLSLVRRNDNVSKNGLIYRILNSIYDGKMRVIKKDKQGNFLTCDGRVINPKSLKGKWGNEKCLIPSDAN